MIFRVLYSKYVRSKQSHEVFMYSRDAVAQGTLDVLAAQIPANPWLSVLKCLHV